MKAFYYLLAPVVAFSMTSCFLFPPYYQDRYHDNPNRNQPPHNQQDQLYGPHQADPNQLPEGETQNQFNQPQNGFNQPNPNQPTLSPPTNNQSEPSIPVARSVPGKPGFVFSPYNNKIIDVKDFPSGTLVSDPNYPQSEKKYFRVP